MFLRDLTAVGHATPVCQHARITSADCSDSTKVRLTHPNEHISFQGIVIKQYSSQSRDPREAITERKFPGIRPMMAAQLIAKVGPVSESAQGVVSGSKHEYPEVLLVFPEFTIRRYRPSDAERLSELANNKKVARNMLNRFPHPYTLDDAKAWIARNSSPSSIAWAVSSIPDGPIIGGCGFDPGFDVFSANAEIGYWVAETHWGQGLATKIVTAITNWAFEQKDGIAEGKPALLRIGAGVFGGNPASEKVLTKCGYEQTGCMKGIVVKFGEIRDMEIFSLTRNQWAALKYSNQSLEHQ